MSDKIFYVLTKDGNEFIVHNEKELKRSRRAFLDDSEIVSIVDEDGIKVFTNKIPTKKSK